MSSSSRTANRKAALAKFRDAKLKRIMGEDEADDLFDGNMKEEEDVYDVVDEDEYQTLVNSRRQREDFVVDDDGLGYYDDGEERLGDEDGVTQDPNKKRSSTAALTAGALKKARKAKAALRATSMGGADNDGNKDDDAVVASNRSMWEFVRRGANVNRSAAASSSSRNNNNAPAPSSRNVDDLLGALDNLTAVAPSKSSRGRSSSAGAAARCRPAGRSASRPRSRTPSSSNAATSRRRAPRYAETEPAEEHAPLPEPDDDDEEDDSGFATFGDDDNVDDHDHMELDPPSPAGTGVKEADSKGTTNSLETPAKQQGGESSSNSQSEMVTPFTDVKQPLAEVPASSMEKEEAEPMAAPKRRLLAPKRLMKRSVPAQKAAEEEKKVQETTHQENKAAGSTTTPAIDTSSISFSPEDIAAESSTSTAAAATLESYVITGEDGEDERYVDMFWMDAIERRGDIYIYGKVASPIEPEKIVSCCAVVKGNMRNLFVLPRKGDNGDYVDMASVHQEMKGILQPQCIPKVVGASWAGKVVERKYAFEDPEVPREPTNYLKVVYDAKYPSPAEDVCHAGGQYVHKILNGKASILESFILKRKLMGPCWLRIKAPEPNKRGIVSWCALELEVESPKQINRLDTVVASGTAPRPSPPVVSVTLKLKTIVNPKTHKNEIVSVSAVCHKQVQLDSSTDQSRRFMTQLSLIRPIHMEGSNEQGMAKFPRDFDAEVKTKMPQLKRMANERALLSMLVNQIGTWDPDVLVGHHAWGHDIQVLLARCVEHKIKFWSKIGRNRKIEMPNKSHFTSGKDWAIADALSGRLLCDTYLSAKEHLRETTYSLKNLAETQLKTSRQEIEPMDVPAYFQKSSTIVSLALHTLNDAQLVQRLMFKLQILPLSKQLTNIAGNLWSHTMKSNRAERTEYLLLHEFHRLKYLVPEKHRSKREEGSGKAKYSGGLVLEPKKGLYDTFILLLDFNSLYPSLIQEYNLCFTTVHDWATFHKRQVGPKTEGEEPVGDDLPPIPDESQDRGVLPKVIKNLVERRRAVKGLMKKESNPEKQNELDIKQKAFKLTANSMYGCLGFSFSRFYAQPIAAMVTSMGRQTLQKTVDISQSTVGLEVIYGDTDSIMINTRISDINQLSNIRKLGEQVKREVNKLYKTLELEIDGIFKCMLLLKKKKYAAITVEQKQNGEIVFDREEKGLDLVRRDWCVQSKDSGRYVLDQILSSDQDKEVSVSKIFTHLEELATKMRNGELPLSKYVITKGLSKHPNDYPDGKALPHVHVAKMMLKNKRTMTVGDHIPYIIMAPLEGEERSGKISKNAAERARHPDEIERSGGVLKPDVEWYLTQQILPPVSRLCEPIEGLSAGLMAERLGLDSSKYTQRSSFGEDDFDEDKLVSYVPESFKSDEERFQGVQKLMLTCAACGVNSEFPGLLYAAKDDASTLRGGFQCTNPECNRPHYWGENTPYECMARIMNSMALLARQQLQEYYKGVVKCDDPACGLETRQLSVNGGVCLNRGCNGRMTSSFKERTLQTQLKYLECLFDADHVCRQLASKEVYGTKTELEKYISKNDREVSRELYRLAKENVDECAYNWISPSFWQSMFGGIRAKQ